MKEQHSSQTQQKPPAPAGVGERTEKHSRKPLDNQISFRDSHPSQFETHPSQFETHPSQFETLSRPAEVDQPLDWAIDADLQSIASPFRVLIRLAF